MKSVCLILLFIVNISDCVEIDSHDLLDDASEIVEDILAVSGTEASPISIIYVGKMQSNSSYKPSKKLQQMTLGVASFMVEFEKDVSSVVYSVNQLHRTSTNPYLIVTGNKMDLLLSILEDLKKEKLLVWSTRLLVIMRSPLSETPSSFRKVLSEANAMVIVPASGRMQNRWKIAIFIPYSHSLLEIATWTHTKNFTFNGVYGLFPNKFERFLDGGTLSMTTVVYPPHTLPRENDLKMWDDYDIPVSGPLVEFLNILAKSMNFRYRVTFPSVIAFGFVMPNGTWGGMIGELTNNRVDLALQLISASYARYQVVDFTVPILIDTGRILARKGETEVDPWGFFLPLSPVVWALLIASLIAVVAVSLAMSALLTSPDDKLSHYSAMNFIRIFLIQDSESPRVKHWSRSVLVASWMIAILIVMESYAGNLFSLLTVRFVPQPHHSVRAVADDPRVTVIMSGGGSFESSLRSMQSGAFKELADAIPDGKISFVKFTQYYEMANTKVTDGGHVLMGSGLPMKVVTTRIFSETGNCYFYFSRERFFSQILVLATQKKSPLLPALNKKVAMIRESGLYNYWLDNVFVNSSSCEKAPTKILVRTSLSLYNIWGMLVTLSVGYLLGLVMFCMELLTSYFNLSTKNIPVQ